MIQLTPHIAIEESDIEERFVRSSGPGGQNVNKVSTAVELRFNAAGTRSLSQEIKERLLKLAGNRITDEGSLIIDARRFRTQERNRFDALERLAHWLKRASARPKSRRTTRPSATAREKRLNEKHQHSEVKRMRGKVSSDD